MRTVFGAFALLSACGNATSSKVFTPLAGADGGYVSIGSACTPALENNPSFGGFARDELVIESSPGQPSEAPVCLVYHFQGRVSCPYGQASPGDAGPTACTTPKAQSVLVGVAPQCLDRRPANVVVWSCKCADSAPDGGESFCDCPSGTSCTQTAADLGGGVQSYCLPSGATALVTCSTECEPGVHPCN